MNIYTNSRVLVTGATGFIGQHLCKRLVDMGLDVYAISRKFPSSATHPKLKSVSIDLKNRNKTRHAIYSIKPDIVYHLASVVDSNRTLSMVTNTLHNNLVATINLFVCLTELGCRRIVLASTSEANNVSSDFTLNSPYAVSKEAVAQYTQMFYRIYHLPVAVARIFFGYGPGQSTKKLIPYTITRILQNKHPNIQQGKRVCDFIHVSDITTGLVNMSIVEGLEGTTVDLGTGVGAAISEVVSTIAALMHSSIDIEFNSPNQQTPPPILADKERTTRLLGFQPHWGLREGLEETIQWYKDQFYGQLPTER